MACPGSHPVVALEGGMDEITCKLVDTGVAHDLCVEMGASPLPSSLDIEFGVAAYRNEVPVGAMMLSRLDLTSPTALPTFSLLRHRVNKTLRSSHQHQVRVSMLSDVAGLVAGRLEERVRISVRVARGKPEHARVMVEAGWLERPTCWTTIGYPHGGPDGGGQLARVAEMWGEAV